MTFEFRCQLESGCCYLLQLEHCLTLCSFSSNPLELPSRYPYQWWSMNDPSLQLDFCGEGLTFLYSTNWLELNSTDLLLFCQSSIPIHPIRSTTFPKFSENLKCIRFYVLSLNILWLNLPKNMAKHLLLHLNTLLSLLDWERLLAGITPAPLVTHACLNRPLALALAVRAVTIVAPDPRPSIVTCLGCPPKCWTFIFSHSNAEIMSPNP